MRNLKVLDLDKLPVNPVAVDATQFLGVTDEELWEACKEYERRMKATKDPHVEFGLKRDLILEVAGEVSARNLAWMREHLDQSYPSKLLSHLHEAPQDKPAWVLKLLRRHGLKRVELVVWVAADRFLSKWIEKFGQDALSKVLTRFQR